MNKLHFFIENGILKVIKDLPKKSDFETVGYTESGADAVEYMDTYGQDAYQSALKAAKRDALEVDNPDEVLDKLWRSDERINGPIPFLHWKENMLPYPKDTIYSLEGCEMEVQHQYWAYTNHWHNCDEHSYNCMVSLCETSNVRKVALITFSKPLTDSKPMNEEKYLLIEVFADNGEHSHYALIESSTGVKVWSQDPAECKAQGHPVVPPLPVEDKLSKIVEYVDGSKIASRFKGLTIPVLEYNEAMAVLKKSLPVEDKEELKATVATFDGNILMLWNEFKSAHDEYQNSINDPVVNPNGENTSYFRGKADAYGYAARMIKAALKWHGKLKDKSPVNS
jgi:hypothetical protein